MNSTLLREYRFLGEEPADRTDALEWMLARKPGGDLRVICFIMAGAVTDDDAVVGLTFHQTCSFTPFFETRAQVDRDIALGHPYHVADVGAHTEFRSDITDRFGSFPPAICSTDPTTDRVGDPLTRTPTEVDWLAYHDHDFWAQLLAQQSDLLGQAFITRRSRRLGAWFPVTNRPRRVQLGHVAGTTPPRLARLRTRVCSIKRSWGVPMSVEQIESLRQNAR